MVGMGQGRIKRWHKKTSITRKSHKNTESYTPGILMQHGVQVHKYVTRHRLYLCRRKIQNNSTVWTQKEKIREVLA